MTPTIHESDRIIVNRHVYRFRDIERDVVVFTPPAAVLEAYTAPDGDVPFVRRVAGLPGFRVEAREGGPAFVNGPPLRVENARPNNSDRIFPPVARGPHPGAGRQPPGVMRLARLGRSPRAA